MKDSKMIAIIAILLTCYLTVVISIDKIIFTKKSNWYEIFPLTFFLTFELSIWGISKVVSGEKIGTYVHN